VRSLLLAATAAAVVAAGCGDDGADGSIDAAATDAAIDARVIDARLVDAAPMVDAGPGVPGWAGCGAVTAFMDLTAPGATRVITPTSSFVWVPQCIRIKRGQMVTWNSELFHPLRGAAGNPGTEIVSTAMTVTYQLSSLGTYGFHCGNHGFPDGSGMAGAVEVVP